MIMIYFTDNADMNHISENYNRGPEPTTQQICSAWSAVLVILLPLKGFEFLSIDAISERRF